MRATDTSWLSRIKSAAVAAHYRSARLSLPQAYQSPKIREENTEVDAHSEKQ